jgi:IS30 family transposase
MDLLLSTGMSYRAIGKKIGISASAICREIARNSEAGGFAEADGAPSIADRLRAKFLKR